MISATGAAAAPRVVSLDQCADQYVLALSPRSQIVSLSPRASAPDSYMRAAAIGLPMRRPSTETILGERPTVVVRSWGGGAGLATVLKRRGIAVAQIDEASDFPAIRTTIRKIAADLGQSPKGERLIARMDVDLAAAKGAWRDRAGLYLTSGGFSAGPGSLIDAMMSAAGMRNVERSTGFSEIKLEPLVLKPPKVLVLGFFEPQALSRWSPGRAGAMQRLIAGRQTVRLPASMLGVPRLVLGGGGASPGGGRKVKRLLIGLALALLATAGLSLFLGEVQLSAAQYRSVIFDPGSPAADIIWALRAPRFACAAAVGGALGLAGAVMQGLLRNPLADPGVLGVSACAALAASVIIALGLAAVPGVIEVAALLGALGGGLALTALAARFPEAEVLILFGVGLSSFAGAATALIFNLSPSLVTTADLLNWLMGSVENRSWGDLALAAPPFILGAGLCLYAARGLAALTLGEEGAALSGLPMARLRMAAVAGASILTGASVALAGVVGFVGLAAPHMVRRASGEDPQRILLPRRAGRRHPAFAGRYPHSHRSIRSGTEAWGHRRPVRRALLRSGCMASGAELAILTAPLLALTAANVVRDGRTVLQNVAFSVAAGEMVGVIGCNGAGKTTLLRAALGLQPLSNGEAKLGGTVIGKLSEPERARRVGYLPQERRLGWGIAAWRVASLGCMDLPPKSARRVAEAALDRVGASALSERGVFTLSGGERARVLLARLLATRAPLLVADEPIAGLDPDAQLLTLDILQSTTKDGGGVLITLHDLGLAHRYCQRLLVLADGEIIADGSPAEVLEPSLLRDVFTLDGGLIETPHGPILAARRLGATP